ncbi:Transcription factor, MADS-box [Dillenia turbinata]|uniref:Transcription factor, MADS-box n=1 Tax=Dillenia turbinata TaxID=194707 RepID=A0AAN8VV73_9MAGN
MVRGKVELKKIENATNRQASFTKRRNGLLKKAYELSVLCEAEVAVIIFSPKGKLYEFSSSSDMRKTIQRYRSCAKEVQCQRELEGDIENLKHEVAIMAKNLEHLEVSQRKLLGQGMGLSSYEELEEMGTQLERSLEKIRARKAQLFKEMMEQLRAREKILLQENARLRQQAMHLAASTQQRSGVIKSTDKSQNNSEVETELFIGLKFGAIGS